MYNDTDEFVNALDSFVCAELRLSMQPADYNNEAVQIVDARNHLFRNVGVRATDEEEDIYAIRELCHVDEDTLDLVPNRMKLQAIARSYFS